VQGADDLDHQRSDRLGDAIVRRMTLAIGFRPAADGGAARVIERAAQKAGGLAVDEIGGGGGASAAPAVFGQRG